MYRANFWLSSTSKIVVNCGFSGLAYWGDYYTIAPQNTNSYFEGHLTYNSVKTERSFYEF